MIRLAACGTLMLLAACPEPERGACDRSAQQTLIFYDQSASSVADEPTTELFREALRDAVQSRLECPGDAIDGFLVHANTRGKAGHVKVQNMVDTLGNTEAMPTVVRARKEAEHKGAMEEMWKDGEAQLAALLAAQVDGRLREHTDLIGTLEVINDEIRKAGPADTLPVHVVYLGDMHESMSSPRRDFDRNPPKSVPEAQSWADADVALLDEMQIDRARMGRVHVRVLLGNLANKDDAGPQIRRYWERLFEHAGIRHVEYN